ncbi:hypothetical protein Aperf_G00000120070 [Anoplocephala perfoliata]
MIARQRDHPSHSEIYWALYEPINVKGKPHNSSSEPLLYEEKFRNGMFASQIENKDDDHSALCLERERSSHRNRMAMVGRPMQKVAWFKGEDYKFIPQPLFHVNNTQGKGVSWLTIRAFPVEEKIGQKLAHELAAQVPYEKNTCVMNRLVVEKNIFTANSNGR